MGKYRRIWLGVFIIVVAGTCLWWAFTTQWNSEPMYKGHPLSFWMEQMDTGGDIATDVDYHEALWNIGTNAIPTSLGMLEAHDSPLKLRLMEFADRHHVHWYHPVQAMTWNRRAGNVLGMLGARAKPAIPELIRIYDENVSTSSRVMVCEVLYNIGPDAKAAVPSLVQGLTSTNVSVRNQASKALGRIQAVDTTVKAGMK